MAISNLQIHLSGLARRLVKDGLLAEADATEAHEAALRKRQPLVSYLVENKLLSSAEIANAACQEFGVPLLIDQNHPIRNLAPGSGSGCTGS